MDREAIYQRKIAELEKREQELLEQLQKRETFYEKILDEIPMNIFVEDKEGRTIFANKQACECNGKTRAELVGQTVFDFFPRTIAENQRKEDLKVWKTRSLLTKEVIVHFKGEEVHMYTGKTIIELEDGLKEEYLLGFGLDISARKIAEQKIEHMAYHDALTGLPNRWFIQRYLEEFLTENKTLAVFILDLDHFKTVNDSMGHQAGDELLKEVSKRLRSMFPEEYIIARWGGDEFILLAPNLENENEIITISEEIIHMMSIPFSYADQQFLVTTSIGISLYPFHGPDIVTLLKNADRGLYTSKNNGRNGYEIVV
ncbi:GGDEF domain-containing protein [Anaerobacillus sp. CMMVII]|uniref:GGDEF domain-containing protein n=1 Tax=Anaerobacillus sp. CMMVII TaxID=2755588 RepID=UPI0021B81525|nr:GGDEF domain-containing protein [Anaerobacillus sp. CMMVII]MCT8139415.1 GGDEF domain-containing protein [Anaerobacillus sp. CMMVII]